MRHGFVEIECGSPVLMYLSVGILDTSGLLNVDFSMHVKIKWLYQYFDSPFEVKVGTEAGPQKVRAWGPGLESGVVGKSADFVVEAIGDDVGTLGE